MSASDHAEHLSAQNPAVKRLRRLVSQRKARSAERAFVAEGPVLVAEALRSIPERVEDVLVDAVRWSSLDELESLAVAAGVRMRTVTDGVIASILDTSTPQPIAAVIADRSSSIDQLAADEPVLVLHELRDPGNVGTLIRTAEAAGFGGVVLTGESVDASNPKVVRAAAGARFRTAVVVEPDAPAAFRQLRDNGHVVAATVVPNESAADEEVIDHLDADLATAAIVLGNEAHGLDVGAVAGADIAITIPLAGPTESLNVAAAGAVVCFASWNQRRRESSSER